MRRPTYLHGGSIHIESKNEQPVEALLIEQSHVRAFGSVHELEPIMQYETEQINLEGRSVIPGLIDSHIHLEKYARQLKMVDCEQPTIADCLERLVLQAAGAPSGSWILGHGWNQNTWGRFGTLEELDAALPNHPAYLTTKSLHAAWVNTKALQIAGINDASEDPDDGVIGRDSDGSVTGILFEGAMRRIKKHIPAPSAEQLADDLLRAQSRLAQVGLTGVHDFDGPDCLHALQLLRERANLRLRILKNIPMAQLPAARDLGLRSGFGDTWIRIGNIKVFADGALGPRTAAMLQPYDSDPENRGMLLLDGEALVEIFEEAGTSGFGMTVHAIGDRANHEVLNAFDHLRQFESARELPHRRHRIEHLQILHPDDLHRPSELELVASMQPIHATSDMEMADQYWGGRAANAYAWRSQLNLGTRLAFGSDAPVEVPDPLLGIHAAVTRRRVDGSPGEDGWKPEQRISLADSLAAYTSGPAYAAGTESWQGSLAPGYAADLVVLSQNPFAVNDDELLELKIEGTMVDGEWSYRAF